MGRIPERYDGMEFLIFAEAKEFPKFLLIAGPDDTASYPVIPGGKCQIADCKSCVRVCISTRKIHVLHDADEKHRFFSGFWLSLFRRQRTCPFRIAEDFFYLLRCFYNHILQRLFIHGTGRISCCSQHFIDACICNRFLFETAIRTPCF